MERPGLVAGMFSHAGDEGAEGAAYAECAGGFLNVAGDAALSTVPGGLARQLQSAYADKSWSYYVYSWGS